MHHCFVICATLLVIGAGCDASGPSGGNSTNATTSQVDTTNTQRSSTPPKPHPSAAAVTNPSNWIYSETRDEMRGTTSKTAQTESTDEFPNMFGMSPQATALFVRRKNKDVDVAIMNSNLQFECNSFSNTHVAVKFDSGPVTNYECSGSKSGTYGLAFIESEARFLKSLRHAKKVIVEAEVYQKGQVQQHFNVEGFIFPQ